MTTLSFLPSFLLINTATPNNPNNHQGCAVFVLLRLMEHPSSVGTGAKSFCNPLSVSLPPAAALPSWQTDL